MKNVFTPLNRIECQTVRLLLAAAFVALLALPGRGQIDSLPFLFDTVYCDGIPQTPTAVRDTIANWYSQISVAFGVQAADSCSSWNVDGTPEVTPVNVPDNSPACQVFEVEWTVTCDGQPFVFQSALTLLDTVGPIIVDSSLVANDTISCSDPIPPVPLLTIDSFMDCNVILDSIEFDTTLIPDVSDPTGCGLYNFVIERRWTVRDTCGMSNTYTQLIVVRDVLGPTFTAPADTSFYADTSMMSTACITDVSPMVAGMPTGLTDNCAPDPSIRFSDDTTFLSCLNSYDIIRTWTAEDTCGNITSLTQAISVFDTIAPTFTVPPDTTVSCELADDPAITGLPTNLQDNCGGAVNFFLRPAVISIDPDCPNEQEIIRTWVVEDECGNRDSAIQIINTIDTTPPSFLVEPQDLAINCVDGVNIDAEFQNWITSIGGGAIDDNCSLVDSLTVFTRDTAGNVPAVLPPADCPDATGLIRGQQVWFVLVDECGNRDSLLRDFTVFDTIPPQLADCPTDQVLPTDPGVCERDFVLEVPTIIENCGSSVSNVVASDTTHLRGPSGMGVNDPVEPVELDIPLPGPLPFNAFSDGLLTINLFNVDADSLTETFFIRGEDGSLLDITRRTSVQCGDTTQTLTLTKAQIDDWGTDGVISLLLEPNIPADPNFAVNNICNSPGYTSLIEAILEVPRKDFSGLVYAIQINSDPRDTLTTIKDTTVTLEPGANQIAYFISDCGGRTDSCFYTVEIQDQEDPVIVCPDPINRPTDPDSCTAVITLPLPKTVSDNCAAGDPFEITVPADTSDAWIQYNFNPDLGFIAAAKTYTLNGLAADALFDVTLRFDYLADVNSNFSDITLLLDGQTIGTTPVSGDCSTPGSFAITLTAAQYNSLAADGSITVDIVPEDPPVPPAVPGDGINPCNPAVVTASGDVDSTSYVFVTLSYTNFEPVFWADGATIIPQDTFRAPDFAPVEVFNRGVTTVYYTIMDNAGNADTCSYDVTVRDQEDPVVECEPQTTIFINPGVGFDTLQINEFLISATDNCNIDTITLSPQIVSCDSAGINFPVVMTVVDDAAVPNATPCTTTTRVEVLKPQPTATSGLCANDTLFLFANPPPAPGGIVYTYAWSGPDGFTSDLENPVITNIDGDNAGSYTVTITGVNFCQSSGTVQVAIEDLPQTPNLLTALNVCAGENIVLESSVVPPSPTTYSWYQGAPPMGTLLGTTTVPVFTIDTPAVGSYSFYVELESEGCTSAPSLPRTVTVTEIPVASVDSSSFQLCAGETFNLGTPVSGPGIAYEWNGPNGFQSTQQFPPAITASPQSAGVYTLIVSRNGCASAPGNVVVDVTPKPATPNLAANSPVCEGDLLTLTTDGIGATYTWISPQLQQLSSTGDTLMLTANPALHNGNWQVFVTAQGCSSDPSAPFNVVINPLPLTNASAVNNFVCEGGVIELIASPVLPGASYKWAGPVGFTSSLPSPTIPDAAQGNSGTYLLEVTTAEGCSAEDVTNITIFERPVITSLSNNAPDCAEGFPDIELVATIVPDLPNYDYNWQDPDGNTFSTDTVAILSNASPADNGTYTLVVSNSAGCTSEPAITNISLSLAPSTPAAPALLPGQDAQFCVGEALQLTSPTTYSGDTVTYYWMTPAGIDSTDTPSFIIDSLTPADAGEYRLFVVVDGCASPESGITLIDVNPVPIASATSNSPVCEGNDLELTGQPVTNATYSWQGPNSSSSQRRFVLADVDTSAAGPYEFVVTLNGCSSEPFVLNVDVKPKPGAPVLSNSSPICLNSVAPQVSISVDSASALDGATYVFFDPQGQEIGSTPALSFLLPDLAGFGEGVFPITAVAEVDGCRSDLATPTEVILDAIPNQDAFAGENFSICQNQPLVLNAEAPVEGTGQWRIVSGTPGLAIANPNQPSTSVNGVQANTTYLFAWSLSNGSCINYAADTVAVAVTEPVLANAGEDVLTCEGDVVNLAALPPPQGNGVWSQSPTQVSLGVELENPNDPNTLISGLEPGNIYQFTWTVNSACGQVQDEVLVVVSDSGPDAGADQFVCNTDSSVQLSARPPADGSQGMWSSPNEGVTFLDPDNPNTLVTGLLPGLNPLVWTIDGGFCGASSRDTVRITFRPNPVAVADVAEVPFNGEAAAIGVLDNDLHIDAVTLEIVKMPDSGTAIIDPESNIVLYTPEGNFVGTDQFTYQICSEGCTCATGVVTVNVGGNIDREDCFVPSIFTPNGDGVNDFFVIPCLLVDNANTSVSVYNRWGDEVFSAAPYNNDWRGTFNGDDLPVGTYFYAVDFGDGRPVKTGYIYLKR